VIPIGILTRNRPVYLDATLRSLSSTALPPDTALRVFDDASDDAVTKRYLYTDDIQKHRHAWPSDQRWRDAGLGILNKLNPSLHGLSGRVVVCSLGGEPGGVVRSSCRVVTRLFDEFPDAAGVFLLQDDVIFNANWYQRMTTTAAKPLGGKKIGLLAGMRLNRSIPAKLRSRPVIVSGSTAQCYYIAREAFEHLRAWFTHPHTITRQFDDKLCGKLSGTPFVAALINPFVCQHIGVISRVRPGWSWHRGGTRKNGRIGYHSRPPYMLAAKVREFP
jgi:glycosyltransferase involved in cell wall biosynthesis